MIKYYGVIIAVTIGIVAFFVRFPGIGSFMTADEENWMIRSGEYYHDLFRKHDTGGAFKTTHPGATGMWIIGAGIAAQEARVGFDIDTSNLQYFRRAATIPVALVVSIVIGLIAYELYVLIGLPGSILGGALLALDPYMAGLSQIAHLDALLGVLMISSVLALLLWQKTNKHAWLFIGGIAAGLAFGTKLLPALWILIWFGSLLLFRWFRREITFQAMLRQFMFTGGLAILTFYVVWPALWFTPDIGRSFQKDVPTIVQDSHIEFEISEEPIAPITFYARTIAGRTVPYILVISTIFTIYELYKAFRKRRISIGLALVLFLLGYLILVTFVAKKGDRYALPALGMLPIITAFALTAMCRRFNWPARRQAALWFIIIGIAAAIVWSWSPHAIAYSSPLFPQNIRPYSQQGWGEGLEEAAAWLNQSPFIERLYIASWYPSVTATYFQGKTLSLSSRDDKRVGYVVAYRNMRGRAGDDIASNVLDELVNKEPVHTVSIHGVPYVWIYSTLGPYYFRQHVGELTGGIEVGQEVPITKNNWDGIDIAIATFSSRNNTEDVILEVRDTIDAASPIRAAVINASQMKDEEFQRFSFEPIADSAGKTYYISLQSPGSVAGNAITVRYAQEDVLPGQLVLRKNPLREGEKRSDFIRTGDIGYRIP